MNQCNLLKNVVESNSKSRPIKIESKDKEILLKVHVFFMKVDN